jgi:hypothetical protein
MVLIDPGGSNARGGQHDSVDDNPTECQQDDKGCCIHVVNASARLIWMGEGRVKRLYVLLFYRR